MKFIAMGTAMLFLSGCALPPKSTVVHQINAPFDAAQAQRLLESGPNTIKGNAFFTQRGGGVVTCAGRSVHLVPGTDYAKARISAIYGPGDTGKNLATNPAPEFRPNPPEYWTLVKSTKCDAQGRFEFERVADGDFYVQTVVVWQVANAVQGGSLIHRVSVKNGVTASVVLSP